MSGSTEFKLADLVRQHHRSLVRFLLGIVRNRATAEDIAQDVYAKFSAREPSTMAVDYPKTYLFTAARNAALDHAERASSERKYRDEGGEAHSRIPSPEPTPEAHAESDQRLRIMATALNELPAACREAFVLNKLHGLDHRSIAQRLGVSVSMVEKHVMRAMCHCRDRLREHD